MLDKVASFAEAVWVAAAHLGKNAPKIADEIIRAIFPRTVIEAEKEGADRMLRRGVIEAIKKILGMAEDNDQSDFRDIDPSFASIVRRLHKAAYFVEAGVDEYVPVGQLIQNPEWLDSARKLMRRKGEECLAEAKVLDELYEAVMEAAMEPAQ